jgi:sec-independent protein translocase protein TatC
VTEPSSGQTPESDKEETFISHLIELRDRLIKCIYALAACFLPLAFFAKELYDVLAQPLMSVLPAGTKMIATGVIAPFMVPIKIAMLGSVCIALPFILYQGWRFVAPALYNHEKKLVLPLIVSSTLLFFSGIAFCYFFVFNLVFKSIMQFAPTSITVAPDIEAYFNFVLGMFLAFGITFEVPVIVAVLVRMGIVTVAQLKEWRGYYIVGSCVIAAVVTPPDAISMLALWVPLCILYEIGLWFSAWFIKPRVTVSEEAPSA